VETFLDFSLPAAVVLQAAAGRILPSAGLAASEGAGQITPSRVARMTQEENPAMAATAQAESQLRFLFQQGVQDNVVLPHQFPDRRVATVPVPAELEMFLDFDYQKPRDWLTIETEISHTPLFYPLGHFGDPGETKALIYSRDTSQKLSKICRLPTE
jgi:hypothetical protein